MNRIPPNAIAIVGMSGRFPGAPSLDVFWRKVSQGSDCISHFSEAELEEPLATSLLSSFVRARGVIEDADQFDPEFFGMYKREAELTDPQHRVFLECAWEAFENAGYDPAHAGKFVGVFAGCSMNTYFLRHVCQDRAAFDTFTADYQIGSYPTLLGALQDTLATRVAYKLDLRGPAVTVQSACSTSLFAVAQACQSLLLFQCDAALAGGVSITFPQKRGYLHQHGGMGSADGRCRPFDAKADGTVFSSGAGAVLLKRLEDALADNDHIYAIIRGAGVNNDGARKAGFTAPSVEGQAEAIAAALAAAEVSPHTIGYVECHGTATPLGDPIEFAGLSKAFAGAPPSPRSCALGSLKGNFGHLDVAAGVAGLIKTALMLQYRILVPLTHFSTPNPQLPSSLGPFYFPTELTPWKQSDAPRRAGVSSFGVGGTNVHLVLEEPPARAPRSAPKRATYVLPLSAKTSTALTSAASALANHIAENDSAAIEDIAETLQSGRKAFERRAAVVCSSREGAVDALRSLNVASSANQTDKTPLVFMFPGQGAQYPGMAARLYGEHQVFRAAMNEGLELVEPIVGADLRSALLYPGPDIADALIHTTLIAQPALFLFEHALAKLWLSLGIEPDVLIGHSVGEFAAACLAGVFKFEDACRFVAKRAMLMQALPRGAMLAVRLSEQELNLELGDELDLAAVNAPSLCVASGPYEALEILKSRLAAKGVAAKMLRTSHAFHSRSLDPILSEIEAAIDKAALRAPAIPLISSVTGDLLSGGDAASAQYWARHCRAPVRFADAAARAIGATQPILLEVGPGTTLTALANQTVSRNKIRGAAASAPDLDAQELSTALALLWNAGFNPVWRATLDAPARKTPLPGYQFERTRCWIDRVADSAPVQLTAPAETAATIPPPSTMASSMSTSETVSPALTRKISFESEIVGLLEELSGSRIDDAELNATFLELGFDSLFLGQVARAVEKKFQIAISFRQLLSEVPTVAKLAQRLDALSPDREASAAVAPHPPTPNPVSPPALSAKPGVEGLFRTQLDAMHALFAEQLRALHGQTAAANAAAPKAENVTQGTPQEAVDERIRHYRPGANTGTSDLSEPQKRLIEELVRRTSARTPRSKAKTQADRTALADPRTVAGFRPEWKELVYPIIAERAKGSKIWDIDGNIYVDLVNGYGQTAFGHSPDFVVEALTEQIEKGFAIGPQSALAGEVAALIAEMTGNERVTFCNTGSEAVMAAMRVARAVTGRDRVVVFSDDYHGQFDEVLIKAGRAHALPIAPGIPSDSLANMTVLPYGDQQSLDWIDAHGNELAAVIVEPVQSRHPLLRPQTFLQNLRTITKTRGAALVFDEVVTGFRVHPGGMQAVFAVKADLATYGKVVGGGMPIGVLAGSSRFMDALDGGGWRYGDNSAPEVAPTFFAGTFVRHPLALAAARAVLLHLKAEGPALQTTLAKRMNNLVDAINADLAQRGLATRAEGYSSWFYVNFGSEDQLGALFYPYARSLGLHIQEGYPCFLTTAHTDTDIEFVKSVFCQTLDALAAGGVLAGAKPRAPAPARVATTAPLNEPQLEILLAAQTSDEASCAYNESLSLILEGDLDKEALKSAFADVVDRHEALRAHVAAGQTEITFEPNLSVDVEDVDYSADSDANASLSALLAKDATTPFDLHRGPLLRAYLVRLEKHKHVFVFSAHHIVCDGWSTNIVLSNLAHFYSVRRSKSSMTLPAAQSMREHACNQAALANSSARKAAGRYWSERFQTSPIAIEMPLDRPRPARKSFAGASCTQTIDADLVRNVRIAGAKFGCTLFVTMLGALQAVIARLTGQSDIVLGCPSAGQASLDGGHQLLGHCVNLLPLRAEVDAQATLAAHLTTIRGPMLEAFEYSDFTYGELVRKLNTPRDPSRTPLTSILFNLEKLGDQLAFPGLTARAEPNPKAAVNFDLSLNMIESTDGIRIDVDYNRDIFDQSTIVRWVENLRMMLRALVDDPNRLIADVPLLGAKEMAWLLARNPAFEPLAPQTNVATLFSDIAAERGQRPALLCGLDSLSYSDLDARSTRLAGLLAQHGIKKGDRVALLAGRSIETVTAILAILKCAAAYVPLDPTYPTAQLDYMLADSQPKLVLAQRDLLERKEALTFGGSALLVLEDVLSASEHQSAPLQAQVDADDCAYIMYTSGSTGRPKGVMVPHRGVIRLVRDQQFVALGPDQTTLHMSSLAFDPCTLEIWSALLNGGKLAILASQPSAIEIKAAIARHRVTFVVFTTGLFHALVDEAPDALAPVQQVVVGGEVLSPAHVRRVREAHPNCKVVNAYGPTENTVITTTFCPELLRVGEPLPIGVPIGQTSCHVFDQWGKLAPQGAVGHLWTGGEGVALGYFARTELTADRFISDPQNAGRRLYNTGDLVRWRNDGFLEFVGRADAQVKINGFRVELGEVEAAIVENSDIAQSVVIAHSGEDGVKVLHAYVTQRNSSKQSREALIGAVQGELARRLPRHMQPRRIMALDALPMTSNGKINRNALPAFVAHEAEAAPPDDAFANETERKVAMIWSQVLKREHIGRKQPIFSLGADSLHIFRIAARCADQGIPIDARQLMKNPTLAELTEALTVQPGAPRAPLKASPSLADFRNGAKRRTVTS